MPYALRKLPNQNAWKVFNKETKKVHAMHTTLENAKAQIRLLNAIDHEGGALTARETEQFVKAGYKKKKDANKVGDYVLDKSLSSKKNKVYVNPKTKEVVVSNAGTSSATDWANNPSIMFGTYKKTDRYKDAEKVQRKAIAKYGKENITNVAHSQSGESARILAKKGLTENAIAVNPAIIGKKAGKNVDVVRSSGDLVSALTKGKQKTIKAKTYNPLVEHSAPILSRDPKQMYGKGMGVIFGRRLEPLYQHIYDAIETRDQEIDRQIKDYLFKQQKKNSRKTLTTEDIETMYHEALQFVIDERPRRRSRSQTALVYGAGIKSYNSKFLGTEEEEEEEPEEMDEAEEQDEFEQFLEGDETDMIEPQQIHYFYPDLRSRIPIQRGELIDLFDAFQSGTLTNKQRAFLTFSRLNPDTRVNDILKITNPKIITQLAYFLPKYEKQELKLKLQNMSEVKRKHESIKRDEDPDEPSKRHAQGVVEIGAGFNHVVPEALRPGTSMSLQKRFL
jgi:hypothetical protein